MHATVEDYAVFIGAPYPEGTASALFYASELVEGAIKNDLFTVDDNDKATDAEILEALKLATCAQVQMWFANGINPAAGVGALKVAATSKNLGAASVSYDTSLQAIRDQAKVKSLDQLCKAAWRILRNRGLGSAAVGLY